MSAPDDNAVLALLREIRREIGELSDRIEAVEDRLTEIEARLSVALQTGSNVHARMDRFDRRLRRLETE